MVSEAKGTLMAKPDWHVAGARLEAGLPEQGKRWAEALARGSMRAGLYAPRGHDPQSPHDQDEIYIIRAGRARFQRGPEVVDCAAGDLLFVPAGMEHRFAEMSQDFAAWVVFWGPAGGEGMKAETEADRR
jgi:mannose-6-phosphate isomerase-like protein (cupin superfamily)